MLFYKLIFLYRWISVSSLLSDNVRYPGVHSQDSALRISHLATSQIFSKQAYFSEISDSAFDFYLECGVEVWSRECKVQSFVKRVNIY